MFQAKNKLILLNSLNIRDEIWRRSLTLIQYLNLTRFEDEAYYRIACELYVNLVFSEMDKVIG